MPLTYITVYFKSKHLEITLHEILNRLKYTINKLNTAFTYSNFLFISNNPSGGKTSSKHSETGSGRHGKFGFRREY